MLTTAEAAAALQVTRRRVQELIRLGTLSAVKRGRDWHIDPASVEVYKNSPRKAGRPWQKMHDAAQQDSQIDSYGNKKAPDADASKAS